MDLVSWLDANQGFVICVLTFVYVIATILILVANSRSVFEMRQARESESRPYVIVSVDVHESLVKLVVRNTGHSVARNVVILCTPPLDFPKASEFVISKSNLLNKPISNIPPGHVIEAVMGMFWDFQVDDKTHVYHDFRFTVSYEGSAGHRYSDDYHSDLNVTYNLPYVRKKTLEDLIDNVADLKRENTRALDRLTKVVEEMS